MNPNTGQELNFEIITKHGLEILHYASHPQSGRFIPTVAPSHLNLTKLTTNSRILHIKTNYTFCIETKNAIPLGASILFECPSEFPLNQTSYNCSIADSHDNISLPYSGKDPSPSCKFSKNIRVLSITGHLKAVTGGVEVKRFCYNIHKVENPLVEGRSGKFTISVYDGVIKEILLKTYTVLLYSHLLSIYYNKCP